MKESKLVGSRSYLELKTEAKEAMEAAGLMISDTLSQLPKADHASGESVAFGNEFDAKMLLSILANLLEQAVGVATLLHSQHQEEEK